MVEVYYYIPAGEAENAVDCGIKLSSWYDREVYIEGDPKKCISALLNPKDDIERYKSADYKCVKLEVAEKHCFVADRYLYRVGMNSEEAMNMYMGSIIPVENYIFGSYRLPECLITTTVIPGQVSLLNKRLDSPILYTSSEELYINNIIEIYKESNEDFYDCLLYNFFCKLAEIGKADKIEDNEKGIAIFIDKEREKAYTVKIPDMGCY